MTTIEKYMKCLQEDRDYSEQASVKAIVKRGDYILLLRRREGCGGAGQWDLPGGHIEKGEDKLTALKREVWEEANLKIDNEKFKKNVKLEIPEIGIDSVMAIYTADAVTIDVNLKPADWEGSDGIPEHNEYKWVQNHHDVENLPMLPQVKEVIMKELK
jgi:8-oxo-dGTP pyrophosphatase MutT (NUDIX family)